MASKGKVLDSSFLIALHSIDDSLHEQAIKDLESIRYDELFVTNYVIHEIGNLLTRRKEYQFLSIILLSIKNSFNMKIVDGSGYLEIENFLTNIENTKLSYTDISLALYCKYYNYELMTYDKELKRFFKKYLN